MIKKILFCMLSFIYLNAIEMEELTWPSGMTLLGFFEENSIPVKIYYNLEKEDQELGDEIISGTKYQILKDPDNKVLQALIPINDELQMHIYQNLVGKYIVELIPIDYKEEDRILSLELSASPYNSIRNATGSNALANAFTRAFKGNIDFNKQKKGDKLIIIYTQKRRMGRIFGTPYIKAASIQVGGKFQYSYQYNDKFYDENAKELEKFFLKLPLKSYNRISSKFDKKRFHPILKRYRAHLGIDYAAPKGTAILSAGDGVVSFIGKQGGYGNLVKIKHNSTYTTLYGHVSGFAKNLKKNQKVKQGQIIAYVGSTGMSTGPHLHFGLYKNNIAINPDSIVKISKGQLEGSEKKAFLNMKYDLEKSFKVALSQEHKNAKKEETFENTLIR